MRLGLWKIHMLRRTIDWSSFRFIGFVALLFNNFNTMLHISGSGPLSSGEGQGCYAKSPL